MPADYVQVAPNSTGAKLNTRSRTVGTNTVHDQYVIASQSDAVPINRTWLATLRIPSRVVVASGTQVLFTVWNGIASGGNNVSCRRLTVEMDTTLAQTTFGPFLRLYRMTTQAATPGGTVITPERQFTSDPAMNSLVSVRADHGADNASAGTQLAAGTLSAQPMWSQTCPRIATAVGFYSPTEFNMMPNDSTLNAVDPLIIRPQEGFAIQFVNGGTATTATSYTFQIKAVLAEFTYP